METPVIQSHNKERLSRLASTASFFIAGALLAVFVMTASFVGLFYAHFRDRIYPNIKISNVDVSAMTKIEAQKVLEKQYSTNNLAWRLNWQNQNWLFNSSQLKTSLKTREAIDEAYGLGRKANLYQSFWEIWKTYLYGKNIPLKTAWDIFSKNNIQAQLRPNTDYPAIDAQFKFQSELGPDHRGRVVVFVQSKEGQTLDSQNLESQILQNAELVLTNGTIGPINVFLQTRAVQPLISSDAINKLGIVQKLGQGESYFYDSIPERVYNIGLGAEKINGSLVSPGEAFSFNQAIGTVSAIFGFRKAYAIIQGKTVLDDGGGVCQVSTTLYRAVINSGLPVVERVAHSYRVGFYEEGGFLPGLDATVYPPSPDFKFKNDTGSSILIQATFDKAKSKLTFELFGTSDGRVSTISKPIILSTSPPPEPVYEDDATLPAGQVKQIDTAHAGAKVFFTRRVKRGDEILIDERVDSDYVPWPARYLRGTKT